MPSPDEAKERYREIRAYAKRTGLSQRLVGEHFGVSAATVNTALRDGKPRIRKSVKGRCKDREAQQQRLGIDDDATAPPDVHQTLAEMLADQQAAIREAENDAQAARLRREAIPLLKLLQQTAPPPEEAAGMLVDPVAMAELGRSALVKLRDYADRAVEELLAKVRGRELSPDALEVLQLIGVLPGEDDD